MNVTSNNRVRFGLGSILVEIELVEIRTRLIIRHKEHMSQCQRIQLDLKLNTSRITINSQRNERFIHVYCILVSSKTAIWAFGKWCSLEQMSGHSSKLESKTIVVSQATSTTGTIWKYGALRPRRQILAVDDRWTPVLLDALNVPHQVTLHVFLVQPHIEHLRTCPWSHTCNHI